MLQSKTQPKPKSLSLYIHTDIPVGGLAPSIMLVEIRLVCDECCILMYTMDVSIMRSHLIIKNWDGMGIQQYLCFQYYSSLYTMQ